MSLNAFDKMLGAINTVLNVLFIYAMAQSAFDGNLGFGGGRRRVYSPNYKTRTRIKT